MKIQYLKSIQGFCVKLFQAFTNIFQEKMRLKYNINILLLRIFLPD